jgi:hypothetical protein
LAVEIATSQSVSPVERTTARLMVERYAFDAAVEGLAELPLDGLD